MLRALGQPGIMTEIGWMKEFVVARCMDPMEAVQAEELDNQLAHARVEFEDGSGGGVSHVEDAVVGTFLESKCGQFIPVA